ncbi:MAG: hypothetical protein ABI147_03355, partial [Acidobacteriaceae bacterium]
QQANLLKEMRETLKFVSDDTGLEIKHEVKAKFETRAGVNAMLRSKFDEDKSARRMEREELVLKKFGLIDRDFQMRPFLLTLLTEQIAGFYDNKTKQMTLLDWVPMDQQVPVMAHELTHALQDQRVNLTKWDEQSKSDVAKNAGEDNAHIAVDEQDTAREAVLEGQAMVSFADYLLKPSGKSLKDMPQVADELKTGAGDMGDSPVLARAPLLLQQALLFPYTAGLGFEQYLLVNKGTKAAFAGALDAPPSSSFEILHPEAYVRHAAIPVMRMPDIHPLLSADGWEPYDIGVMGELDVRITAELFGGRPLAEALAPNWEGGIYYAAQKKSASAAEKKTTKSVGLMYASRWKNDDSARNFFTLFENELPRQYDGLQRRQKDETDEYERVYSTNEGDVLLSANGNGVWVSEGFDLATARKMRDAVTAAQGVGPVQSVGVQGIGGELVGGMSQWLGSFGMVLPAVSGK